MMRNIKKRWRIYTLAAGIVAMLLTVLYAVWQYRHDATDTMPIALARTIPNTDVNPYGANFFLEREVEDWKRDKTLRMAREAGIGWVKQQFPWEEIEPHEKGKFWDERVQISSWTKYDRIVELGVQYNLQIIARLDRPPDWTRRDNRYKQAPPDDYADYGDFVYEFVRHYRGRIHYVQIWNEPNIWPEWGDRAVNPQEYVELLRIAYRRAKEADPNVYVLSAPLAITLEDFPIRRNLSDLVYLEEMYQAGAKDYFDILSANAFGMDLPPEDPPDPRTLNFRRVRLHREIMERYGDANKPIWINEYGWNAAPDTFTDEQLPWKRVSEEEQAQYTLRGIQQAHQEWPWAGVFNIWYFRQVGNISPDHADYYFRMLDVDFTPRLVYYAVKDAAASLGVAEVGHYEETNPAVVSDWERIIEPAATARAYLQSDLPGASLTLNFQGDDVTLITRRGLDGGRLYVTMDGREVDGLPRDGTRRTYVDLYAPGEEWQARVPLVHGAGGDQHVLRLTVSDAQHPDATGHRGVVDAFEVTLSNSNDFPYIQVGTTLVVMVGLGVLLYQEVRREALRQREMD